MADWYEIILFKLSFVFIRFLNGLDIVQDAETTIEDMLIDELEAYGYTGSLLRVATAQELSFSMTFPWLSMTKNYDFPWPFTSYRHIFSPSRVYFREVIKDPLNHTDNIFCNFAAFRKDEAIEIRLLICWCIHQHIYTPTFIESIQIQSG